MKKTFIILFFSTLAVACGNSGDGGAGKKDSTSAPATTTEPAATGADEKGLELIGANDCTTCHKIREKNIGPAYTDVAEKYRDVPHAADTLVQKVIKGGSGNWGTVPMTAHANVPEADVREMVTYILSLKK